MKDNEVEIIEKSGDLESLAEYLFVGSLKPKFSVQPQIDFSQTESGESYKTHARLLFEFLLSLFHQGMLLMFSKNGSIDVSTISPSEFLDMRQRFHAIGYDIKLSIRDDKTKLKSVYFPSDDDLEKSFYELASKGKRYMFSFRVLPITE